MARGVSRGEVWMYEFRSPDKLRPVVVISRNDALDVLHTALVVPVTSTIRGIPSEVVLGPEDGLKHESAASLDHVQTVEKRNLKRYLGRLRPARLRALCSALAVAVGCDEP